MVIALALGVMGLLQGDIGLLLRHGLVKLLHLPNRLREARLGLIKGNAGVGIVKQNQRLAGLDKLGIIGANGDHRAADLRCERH